MSGVNKKTMSVTDASVIKRKQLNDSVFSLTIKLDKKLPAAKPGQFFMLHLRRGVDPMLPRPFGIIALRGNLLTITFKVVGRGTDILASSALPFPVKVWGPLGNGFPHEKGKAVVVAGGLGIVPVYGILKQRTCEKVLIGYKTKAEIFMRTELRAVKNIAFCTDDGTMFSKGLVTEKFDQYLAAQNGLPAVVYACGPHGMLKALHAVVKKYGIQKAYGSFEAKMACGFGVCLGCAMETSSGMVKVCKDGPVFSLYDIFGE